MKDIELFDDAKKLYDILVAVSTGTSYSDPIIIMECYHKSAVPNCKEMR